MRADQAKARSKAVKGAAPADDAKVEHPVAERIRLLESKVETLRGELFTLTGCLSSVSLQEVASQDSEQETESKDETRSEVEYHIMQIETSINYMIEHVVAARERLRIS